MHRSTLVTRHAARAPPISHVRPVVAATDILLRNVRMSVYLNYIFVWYFARFMSHSGAGAAFTCIA